VAVFCGCQWRSCKASEDYDSVIAEKEFSRRRF